MRLALSTVVMRAVIPWVAVAEPFLAAPVVATTPGPRRSAQPAPTSQKAPPPRSPILACRRHGPEMALLRSSSLQPRIDAEFRPASTGPGVQPLAGVPINVKYLVASAARRRGRHRQGAAADANHRSPRRRELAECKDRACCARTCWGPRPLLAAARSESMRTTRTAWRNGVPKARIEAERARRLNVGIELDTARVGRSVLESNMVHPEIQLLRSSIAMAV